MRLFSQDTGGYRNSGRDRGMVGMGIHDVSFFPEVVELIESLSTDRRHRTYTGDLKYTTFDSEV